MKRLPRQSNLTLPEVARFLDLPIPAVKRLILKKGLPCFRIGNAWRVSRELFLFWYKQNPDYLARTVGPRRHWEKVFASKEDCLAWLEPRPRETWNGADFLALHRPIVYIWYRGRKILYVGMSFYGIARIFASHHRLKNVQLDDTITVWFFDNEAEARETERALIEHFQPKFNQKLLVGHKNNAAA